jgi:hypothetical protein
MMTSPTSLPPKMAAQYAERAKRMDGCVRVGATGHIFEFAQGSTVICMVDIDNPMGHFGKDGRRADEIRAELAASVQPAAAIVIEEQNK